MLVTKKGMTRWSECFRWMCWGRGEGLEREMDRFKKLQRGDVVVSGLGL